jgi:hypothetical protein
MVPFLTLRTQGHKERKRDVEENEKRQEPTSEKAVQEKKGQE